MGRRGRPLSPIVPLTDAQRELAGDPKHIRFAMKTADAMCHRCPQERDAYRSAALLGLVEAARHYDHSVQFISFAVHRIRGAVLDYIRDEIRHGLIGDRKAFRDGAVFVDSLSRPMCYSEHREKGEGCAEVGDAVGSEEMPVGWEAESTDTVLVLSARLPGKYGEVLRRFLLDPETETMKQVAESVGLSESRVSQMLSDIPVLLNGGPVAPDAVPLGRGKRKPSVTLEAE